MQVKNLLAGIAAMGVFGAGAQAATIVFDDSNGGSTPNAWNDVDNWEIGGSPALRLPNGTDLVQIPSGETVNFNLSSATIGRLELASGTSVLNIPSSSTLTMDGQSNAGIDGQHVIHGTVVLQASTSKLVFDSASNTLAQVLTGNGSIVGQDAAAEIQVESDASGAQLTLEQFVVQGDMTIEAVSGTATLLNDGGAIVADGGVTLTLAASLILVDDNSTATPDYQALGGSLAFSCAFSFAGLTGDFLVNSSGEMKFDNSVTTTGSLTQTSGTVCVYDGMIFEWNASHYEGTVPNDYECF